MAKGKKSGISRGGGGGGGRQQAVRPTHFLCFPLARESTVSTFAKSINYFQDVSMEPRRSYEPPGRHIASDSQGDGELQGDVVDEWHAANEGDPLGNTTRIASSQPSFEDKLKVLPSIVYRGPGTLHLTLGVMDLSNPAEMEKAKRLLENLDLQKLLRDASKGPPAGMKAARMWNIKEKSEDGLAGSSSTNVKSPNRSISPPPISRSDDRNTAPEPSPPVVSLTGISAFASSKKARVIWAKPRAQATATPTENASSGEIQDKARPSFSQAEQDRLYNFGLHIHYAFKTVGLINETRPIVLHATIANMRYKTQAKGGRTTKGRAWAYGKKRWEDGLVDVRDLVKVFNAFDGDVQKARTALSEQKEDEEHTADDIEEDDVDQTNDNQLQEGEERTDDRDKESGDPNKEFIWCSDIVVDRVAICKMGATKMDDPLWVEGYPPVIEKMVFEDEQV